MFVSFIIVISLACSVTGNSQSTEEAGTEILPTATIEVEVVSGSLQPGETGEKEGFSVLLENYTFEPGCKGVIGFELVLTNNSNKPFNQLTLNVTDNNGQQFYDIPEFPRVWTIWIGILSQ